MLWALQTKLYCMENQVNREKHSITEREKEIIEYLSHGLSEKEIGEKLFISPKTVSNHLDNIRRKLGVSKNIEIVAFYIANLRGKQFNLKLLREYGIGIFIIILNVCTLNELS